MSSASSDPRNLCLLVVFNTPLVVAWLNTLNNEHLLRTSNSQSDYNRDKCWKSEKGLRVWNVSSEGIPTPNAQGLYQGVDVVLITASALQVNPSICWVTKTKWHTVVADEGHDYLRGQHNACPGRLSLTLRNWYNLQLKTKSMFIITGTPFVTKISYDVVAITKAVACEQIRRIWGKEYTDAGLDELVRGWRSELSTMDPVVATQQENLRELVKDKLALFMIRRDENSCIRGQPVMVDYFKQCTVYEEPLVPSDNGHEAAYRDTLYRQHYGNSETYTKTHNDIMRCLSWSYRFIRWQGLRESQKGSFWNDFTLDEAERQLRTRTLIKILKEGKKTGNGVILFVQRVFLAEMCIKAIHLLRSSN